MPERTSGPRGKTMPEPKNVPPGETLQAKTKDRIARTTRRTMSARIVRTIVPIAGTPPWSMRMRLWIPMWTRKIAAIIGRMIVSECVSRVGLGGCTVYGTYAGIGF